MSEKKAQSSQNFVKNLERKINENQEKMDKLISAYIDGDIPRESYLKKRRTNERKTLSQPLKTGFSTKRKKLD